MNPTAFRVAADAATADIPFEADRLLAGVYRKRHQRNRRRRVVAALPVAAALAIGAVTIPSIMDPSTAPAALAAYEFSQAPANAEPVVEFQGVELHYLPEDFATQITGEEVFALQDDSGQVSYRAQWDGEENLGLTVTKGPGLTLDSYMENHWFGGSEETTVGGRPALANGVQADEASGLVWSPQDGIVIEVHLGGSDAEELRRIVEQMSL